MLLYLAKKAVFTSWKVWKEESTLFLLKAIFTKMCFTKFSLSGTVTDHFKFFLNVFHLKSYRKFQVHGSHHAKSNIFIKSVIILTCHICIWNLSVLWFLRTYLQSWPKIMRKTLVLVWNSALHEKFSFNF